MEVVLIALAVAVCCGLPILGLAISEKIKGKKTGSGDRGRRS